MSIVLILLFIILFAIGLGPIPYVYSNEVFAVEARAAGLSLSMFVVRSMPVDATCESSSPFQNWFCNFLVTLLFLPLQSAIGGYVFLIFCILVALAFALLFFKVRTVLSETEFNGVFLSLSLFHPDARNEEQEITRNSSILEVETRTWTTRISERLSSVRCLSTSMISRMFVRRLFSACTYRRWFFPFKIHVSSARPVSSRLTP